MLKIFLLVAFLLLGEYSYGAEIIKIRKKAVVINQGSNDGVVEGATVCFFNESDTKVVCGKVKSVKKKRAIVPIKKKKLKLLGEGMTAEVEGASGSKGRSFSFGFRVMGLYDVMTPVTFFVPDYAFPQDKTTYWKGGQKIGSSYGAAGEVNLPIMGLLVAPGFRYRMFGAPPTENDYDPSNGKVYAYSETTASSFGLFADCYFFRLPEIGLNLGGGLDFDMMTITFSAQKKDDSGATPEKEFTNASSKSMYFSARLVANVNLMLLDNVGLMAGINIIIPVFGSANFSADVSQDENAMANQDKASEDLQFAINHTKGSVGLEIPFGIVASF